jgi:hypothetical protein
MDPFYVSLEPFFKGTPEEWQMMYFLTTDEVHPAMVRVTYEELWVRRHNMPSTEFKELLRKYMEAIQAKMDMRKLESQLEKLNV